MVKNESKNKNLHHTNIQALRFWHLRVTNRLCSDSIQITCPAVVSLNGSLRTMQELLFPNVFLCTAVLTISREVISGLVYLCARLVVRSLHNLESQASQPCFDFLHPVALDFDGPTGANTNGVVPRIFGNGDLQNRSEFVEENVSVARNLFDPRCHSSTVLSVMG